MDELSLKIEKITGVADKHCACGVFNKKVTLADGTLGTIVSCVLVNSDGDEDPQGLLRDIFELKSGKFEGAEGSILEVIRRVSEVTEGFVADRKLEMSFADTFFYENACYIAKLGDGLRILVFDPPKSGEIKFGLGSGPIEPGQIYLIATDEFLSIFDTAVLTGEQEIDLEGIIDGLATEISARDDQSKIGAAFVCVKGEGKQEGTEGVEGASGAIDETEDIREIERTGQGEQAGTQEGQVQGFLKMILRELSKLRRGDKWAVLRLRRNIVVFAGVMLLILAVSVGWTLRQKSQREKIAEFNIHLTAASSKYQEGVAVAELNRSRAREILIEADREVKLALGILEEEKAKRLAGDIAAKLKETETASDVNFEVVWEVASPILSLSISGKNLIGVSGDKILEVDDGKKTREIAGVNGAKDGFFYDGKVFILTGDEVWRLDLAVGESKKIIEARGYHDISVFLGNVYLLSGEQIAKFVPIEGGYFGPTDYLNAKENFGDRSRLAIDGSVWVTAGDKIFKFTRGSKQNFEISGLTSKVFEFGAIYTNSQLDNLYVTDSINLALLVIGKDGTYKRVYQSSEFGKAADFAVSDDESEVYIAVGNKILKADL